MFELKAAYRYNYLILIIPLLSLQPKQEQTTIYYKVLNLQYHRD